MNRSNAMERIEGRRRHLETMLGPAEKEIVHSPIPLHLGGFSDALTFRQYVNGFAYVTSDLVSAGGQIPSRNGPYEVAICTRQANPWAAQLVSRLGRYTFDAALNPGETMDIGPAVPKGSKHVDKNNGTLGDTATRQSLILPAPPRPTVRGERQVMWQRA